VKNESSRSLKKYTNWDNFIVCLTLYNIFEGSVFTFQFFNDKIHNYVFFGIKL
jgi:hypothetical protein